MKPIYLTLLYSALLAVTLGEPQIGKPSPYHYKLPLKNSKQLAFTRSPNNKQKTLVVQIRSDQPVPLVLKGRPNMPRTHGHSHAHTHANALAHPHGHSHVHHHINAASNNHNHIRAHPRPIKLSAPIYLKNPALMRKPLKLKLTNSKVKPFNFHKPATSYDVPFKYEKPVAYASTELVQQLPLESHDSFISDHFAPIHTIPAPNLSLQDNHLHPEETYLPPSSPKPQIYHQKNKNNYQVVEDNTNDQTLVDPFSGSQKLFAPDPDPSLPAAQVRPAIEAFNRPSNDKPLPSDIQSNQLPVAQPLVQIVGAHASKQIVPEIYPIQFTQHAQLQPFLATNVAAIHPAPIPIYNPTYLVTQSNNLYNQHQQQLFKPAAIAAAPIVESGYVNADLTQEVASNGQILQAAKDSRNSIHPVLDVAPHFAALIAAPALDEDHQSIAPASFHLSNIAGTPSTLTGTTEAGFVVSNYYGNTQQDSTQLLQAYAEEEQAEAHRQQYEALQQQLQQQHQIQEQQQQHTQEQHELQKYRQQQQQYVQQHSLSQVPSAQPLQQQPLDGVSSAFEEHQRLVKQQLGADTPLRIFVPDEEEVRLQKRSDEIVKGSIEDVVNTVGVADEQPQDDFYKVSSSIEQPNEGQHQQQQQMHEHQETTSSEKTIIPDDNSHK